MRLHRRVKHIVEQNVLFIVPSRQAMQWTDNIIAPYRAFEGLSKGDMPCSNCTYPDKE